nr:MAG TPA: hypothetical protein [Caudoviricetes sp.]
MRKKEERRKKRERKEDFYEVSDECRMVEGSRHPCCKDNVPDRRGPGRDTDAWWHGRLDGGRQCSDRSRCCVPRYQPCRSAGTGKKVKKTKEKRAQRIRLFQGVVRRRPPQFMIIIPQQVNLFNCL